MKAKQFVYDVKRLFWHPLIILLILLSTSSAVAQIDYKAYPQIIDVKHPIVKIDWLTSCPKNTPIDFNHLVNFINTKNDNVYSSKVTVSLYQNNKLVRSFIFPVGDGNVNRIYTYKPLNLREGDHVYFLFTLSPSTDDEQHVFNIYEEKRVSNQTVDVIKPTGERIIAQEKSPQPINYKRISDAKSRRNKRKPMEQKL